MAGRFTWRRGRGGLAITAGKLPNPIPSKPKRSLVGDALVMCVTGRGLPAIINPIRTHRVEHESALCGTMVLQRFTIYDVDGDFAQKIGDEFL